jgi:hypothetical protein
MVSLKFALIGNRTIGQMMVCGGSGFVRKSWGAAMKAKSRASNSQRDKA